MVCTYCQSKTSIINSRLQKKLNNVWRRHQCISCHAVFTTIESTDFSKSIQVKYPSGIIKPFLRDKLFISILGSLSHRKNALEDATALTDTVLSLVIPQNSKGIVKKYQIVDVVSQTLQKFDQPAATYYDAHTK